MASRHRHLAATLALWLLLAGSVVYAQTDTPTPSPTPTPTATPITPQPNQRTLVPVGTLIMWAGNSTPSGWLVADGSCISRTTYAVLFSVISTTFGVCDGSTTFGVPDLRGRVPMGAGTGNFLTARSPGQMVGGENQNLSTANLPRHTHELYSSAGVQLRVSNGGVTSSATGLNVGAIFVTGAPIYLMTGNGGFAEQAFSIVQPSVVVNFLIWTGTETLDIEGGIMLTNTPDPIRFETTVEVDGTPQTMAFYNSADVGDFTTTILLFVLILLNVIGLAFQIRDRRP